MADYTIIVQDTSLSLVNLSAAEIRDALMTLSGEDRLSALYIKDWEAGTGGTGTMTGNEIVAAVNAGATTEINYTHVTTLPKSRVLHGENTLNWIATVNPASPSFQAGWSSPSAYRVKAWDFIIVANINTTIDGQPYADGDWCIALVDEPGWDFFNTTNWRIEPFSVLATTGAKVFRQHDSRESISGIESIPGACNASGPDSFAPGRNNAATSQSTTALGQDALAQRWGQISESGGQYSELGDCQRVRYQMKLTTTNAAQTEMILPQRFNFESAKTYVLEIQIVARVGASISGSVEMIKGYRSKEWKYKILASVDESGHVWYDGGLESESLTNNTPAIAVALAVLPVYALGDSAQPPPTTYKGLEIKCTGISATTIRWCAFIEAYEIKY